MPVNGIEYDTISAAGASSAPAICGAMTTETPSRPLPAWSRGSFSASARQAARLLLPPPPAGPGIEVL
jgi:hypothetical protein